jgi:hypothetical protein
VTNREIFILGSTASNVSPKELEGMVRTITRSFKDVQAEIQPETSIAILEIPVDAVASVKALIGDRFLLEPNGTPRLVQHPMTGRIGYHGKDET